MIELPMTAFKIGNFIELSLDEVFGFPHEICYPGGYSAWGEIDIRVEGYSVSSRIEISTGELYRFWVELKQCYDTLTGVAVLYNTYCNLELKCQFGTKGGVSVTGKFQADQFFNNVLEFEFDVDQTYIKETLTHLKRVFNMFGDEKGVQNAPHN
jgi:hypothetical protein